MTKKEKQMKTAFMAGSDEPIKQIIEHLQENGFDAKENSYIGYRLADVPSGQYRAALMKGLNFANEKDIKKNVNWVNYYSERQYGNHLPVAYGLLDEKAINESVLKKTEELKTKYVNHTSEQVEEMVRNVKSWETSGWADMERPLTPDTILEIIQGLEANVGREIKTVGNYSDYALEFKADCKFEEQKEVRKQVIDYLRQQKVFRTVREQDFDGKVLKETKKKLTNSTIGKLHAPVEINNNTINTK